MPILKVNITGTTGKCPVESTPDAAGYTIFAAEDGSLAAGDSAKIQTQIILGVPQDTCGHLVPLSTSACGIHINTVIVDRTTSDELAVHAFNFGGDTWSWKVGDPIAQLILEKIEDATVIQVKSF